MSIQGKGKRATEEDGCARGAIAKPTGPPTASDHIMGFVQHCRHLEATSEARRVNQGGSDVATLALINEC